MTQTDPANVSQAPAYNEGTVSQTASLMFGIPNWSLISKLLLYLLSLSSFARRTS